ncbi:MAG: hypothetical protein KDB80_18295 [Planctomycetes bacterium]|nr:hypothetical protein [Planctomycetota bacterium]
MKTLPLSGFVLLVAALAQGCSGVPDDRSSQTGTLDMASGVVHDDVDASAPQDPTIAQERRKALLEAEIKAAQRAVELKLWDRARAAAARALSIDADNERARGLLRVASEMLQDPNAVPDDFVTRSRVAQERDKFRARQEMSLGDANMEQQKYGDAIEHYERADLIMEFNPFAAPNSELRQQIRQRLQFAKQQFAAAMQDREARARAESQAALDRREARAAVARHQSVERLMAKANVDFQEGRFGDAVKRLDEARHIDPNNGDVDALHDLASRAQHENRVEVLRQQWKAEWTKTFDDLRFANVPQVDALVIDAAKWAEVSQREPISFTPPEDLDSPEERAIREKLTSTVVEHRFPNATINDWAKHYSSITDVIFFVHPDIAENEATTLEDFSLPATSVEKALNIICKQGGIQWRVQNGLVELLSGEVRTGRTYLVPYGVHDLVLGVKNKPGPNLKLKVPGEEDPLPDEEDPLPVVVDEGRLEGLITNNIQPDTWDELGVLRYQNGVLMIRHTREVHKQVEKLLSDLRQAVGIQVDIEARFLKVEDSFLEDVGLDFRGLGNQAAEGVAGRGLENNNRSNLRFDDFGRPETVNSAVPGILGSGTEPGVFYDDGGDGDLLARTENLFDSRLGGGEDGLTNLGGLSVQAAYLDDTELEVILRAVQKQERSEEIIAPRLLVYNNTRAHMSALRHTSYIRDFEVEIAQAAAVANPIVDVVRDGVVLDVRPVVSADRRFITIELRPTVMDLQLPIPTFSTTLGSGQPVNIQLPDVSLQSVRTTVTVPDGSTLMLGGMRLREHQKRVSGVPFLKDLPGLSFLFSRKGDYVLNRKLLILIRASIILTEEHAPTLLPNEFEANLLSASR